MTDWRARIAGVRGVRQVEVTEQVTVRATMASEYEQLANEYLEMARGFTGDPSQAQLNASIGSGYAMLALLDQLRGQS